MKYFALLLWVGIGFISGCGTVRNAENANPEELAKESSIVVVRPNKYTLLGTRSVRDYIEVSYEEFKPNRAGLPTIKLGLRSRGGEHWWDLKGPNFTIYAQAVFYPESVKGMKTRTAPLYKTNKQAVVLQRGETADLSFTSPVKGAKGYQVVLSEE